MEKMVSEQRHYNMSQIRGKDTKPEILVRKYLFRRGLRFRKNDSHLPGHPDIVFPKYRTVVFVNGCFWHGHDGCRYFVWPKSNVDFWRKKINANMSRDRQLSEELEKSGWKVLIVWECELRGENLDDTLNALYTKIVNG